MSNELHPDHNLTRRSFTRLGGTAGLAAMVAPACDLLSTEPSAGEGTQAGPADEGNEAPGLAELVRNGELPALAERLPKQPMVVEPVERIGTYGGEWRYLLLSGGCPECLLVRTIGYENLVRWTADVRSFTLDEIIPNVVEDFAINDDATEYTFTLREGMKWSDGEPYTADDVMFWYEDVLSNEDLRPEIPGWLTAGGKPVVVEKIDKYRVVFRFAAANGLFLQRLATGDGLGVETGGGLSVGAFPSHYLRQFLPAYNDNLDEEVENANLDDWVQLFQAKSSAWENPDLPVLNSWMLTDGLGANAQRLTAKRNPYCWKADPEGNQLPYIDRVQFGMEGY